MRILIVDDDETQLELLEALLKRIGFRQIIKTSSVSEAIRLTKAHPPDLFFIDIIMPEMTGGEFREQLKKSKSTKDIPVIFISGIISKIEEKSMRGRLKGGDIIVAKPFTKERISEAITESLQKEFQYSGSEKNKSSNLEMLQ